MKFYVCYKYGLINIAKSKQFLILSISLISMMFLFNLISGTLNSFLDNMILNLWLVNVINSIFIFILTSAISILFSYDFIYLQKKNGIKTIEIKNGLNPWEMFFAKILAIITINIILVLAISTLIVITNLIIFNSNIYVVKLIFINLYSLIFIVLLVMSFSLILNALNWHKVSLVIMGFFVGLVSLFPLVNAALYDFMSFRGDEDNPGENQIEYNYKLYTNYFAKSLNENIKTNELLAILQNYQINVLEQEGIFYVDEIENIEENSVQRYFNSFITNSNKTLVTSGRLFDNIELFNQINAKFLDEKYQNYQVQSNYNIEDDIIYNTLKKADLNKSNFNISSRSYIIKNNLDLVNELETYINNLENLVKNDVSFNKYYQELKIINKYIANFYKQYFYFSAKAPWINDNISARLFDSELKKYFKEEYKNYSVSQIISEVFETQQISSGRIMYQSMLFNIVNYSNLLQGAYPPDNRLPKGFDLFHYYTSPFLWLEYLTSYGFVSLEYDNLATIYSNYFMSTNNFIDIDYENINDSLKINSYAYGGPNRIVMFLMMLLLPIILIFISFYLYKVNLYK